MTFIDLFSQNAAEYAAHRPDYPPALFSYLASLVHSHELVWDCGTGNGQAAIALADYFTQVIATDASEQQIKVAMPKKNIAYRVMPAEHTDLADQSVDLITVALALHWFNFAAFYKEVRRVAKPNAVLTAWCYPVIQINSVIDPLITKLYSEITEPYWAPELRHIDAGYKTIPFPFNKITTPEFHLEKNWNLAQLLAYLDTWSGAKEYIKQKGHNPLDIILPELQTAWGDPNQQKRVHAPLHLLAGKIND